MKNQNSPDFSGGRFEDQLLDHWRCKDWLDDNVKSMAKSSKANPTIGKTDNLARRPLVSQWHQSPPMRRHFTVPNCPIQLLFRKWKKLVVLRPISSHIYFPFQTPPGCLRFCEHAQTTKLRRCVCLKMVSKTSKLVLHWSLTFRFNNRQITMNSKRSIANTNLPRHA